MSDSTMNLKLNNEVRSSVNLLHKVPVSSIKFQHSSHTQSEEERRRTGRYIAILVGISLLLLAVYHAWVRRIPVVASLVVPALIMFVYVGWVLYTASRDKLKMMDAEAALNAAADVAENEGRTSELSNKNIEISVISSKESSKVNSPEGSTHNEWPGISTSAKGTEQKPVVFIKPIILINDKLPEDLDQKWSHIVENITNNDKFKGFPTRRKFKRRFVRRRHNVFKRSYSIA
ncbi:uncharacterized protein [Epargyreus clarus]|uniref:uncharacterized protein isoform X2 n=1 Tax=Epargyreus clarus TaxID=520877 RepID=UPI003C30E055